MPIYEYVCDSCNETHEALQRMSDPPLAECPTGDGGSLTKVYSTHNIGSAGAGTRSFGGGCATPEACGPRKAAMCGMGGGGGFN